MKSDVPTAAAKIVAALMRAASNLRDEADGFVAALGEEDEVTKGMAPLIDAVDEAMAAVTGWLKDGAA